MSNTKPDITQGRKRTNILKNIEQKNHRGFM